MGLGFFNGKYIPLDEPVIPIEERGHQFGDGVYEMIRVYKGKPFKLNEHVERLFNSANAINLPLENDKSYFIDLILHTIKVSGLLECTVYLQITRGIATRNHIFPDVPVSISMTVKEITPLDPALYENGVNVIFHEDERWANCYIKSLNLLPNVLARQKANEKGCFEAILYRDEWVTEGSSSNVFIVKNGIVYTTPLSKRILEGVTRGVVIQICKKHDIHSIEKSFTKNQLLDADEVFITNTTGEIIPIVKVDNVKIGPGIPGKVTKRLHRLFIQEIMNEIG
ncbi:D-amino-acid transaminase [Niallia sp. Krafla_26]|uniref:D-amino-acid transaminase n=1 Tax=Niallia sp. Krafla_26 TaxID=3064703 RepID=UPI003D1771C2